MKDDDLLLQIKYLVQEEVTEYRKNPHDGFTKEEALKLLRSKLK